MPASCARGAYASTRRYCMGLARPRAERIEAARAMFAAGVPKREVARNLRTSARTVGRWVQPSNDPSPPRAPRRPEPAAVLLKAALAWVIRFDAEPNSVTWNATRAWKRGPDAWQRHLQGWGPGNYSVAQEAQAHDVTKQFGSWKVFHKQLDNALRRRRDKDDPYRPRPVPPQVGGSRHWQLTHVVSSASPVTRPTVTRSRRCS